ncbi:S8 family peptidase [Actinoplanes sp. LDG1-06]|uniref:S8 family peptidase n=1 Tax=Paractinoplanes ovalisporus TaxID=2810368 RepID=A0ABS2A2W1_9ACTN|nr:S8 family peptidase [Actinoplanes ovalisporus]MBM2614182.1 S8 family peptidase [Actinoplanes ovalisporus]
MKRREFDLVFSGRNPLLPFATDCPVRYEVWLAFATDDEPGRRHDLMLHASEWSAEELAEELESELGGGADVAVSGDYVAVRVTFAELVQSILPLTTLESSLTRLESALNEDRDSVSIMFTSVRPTRTEDDGRAQRRAVEDWEELRWFTRLLTAVQRRQFENRPSEALPALVSLLVPAVDEQLTATFDGWVALPGSPSDSGPIGSVTLNRKARIAVTESRRTVKADAAGSLFDVSCANITWAVLDSGIDARHPAFALCGPDGSPSDGSRITATYDFTRFRTVMAEFDGFLVDWHEIEHKLLVPQDDKNYEPPVDDHGTHVAGVLGGNWSEEKLRGICPDIRMWDIRVLEQDGTGDEFNILAALQFLRWKNERSTFPVVAGANLSFALKHEVANYSCGWTPVCVEADKLVRSGVVVVTVAGNAAFVDENGSRLSDGTSHRAISITDPGNTESVITVGATHRTDPHRHGVSFFSGRGPTADGRIKPDLLAPGERIDGPIPDSGMRRMTGTSQAAPHVSGAAAMLMSRHRELLGRPERVKEILCGSATDLGRAPSFQGHGLLDVLRAMQAL